jgi:signal transduction histidine kinase
MEQSLVREVLDSADEGMLFVSTGKALVCLNRAARVILRCAREHDPCPSFDGLVRVLGFNPLEHAFEEPAESVTLRGRAGEEVGREDLQGRTPPRPRWQQEVTIFGVPCLVRGRLLSAAGMGVDGMLLWFRDMREERRREQRFSECLSCACHELRTPLTAIRNALDLLHDKRLGAMNERQLRLLQVASRNVERLNNVVTGVFEAGGAGPHCLAVDLEEIEMGEVVDRALTALEDVAREKEIALQRRLAESCPPLLGDPERLEQVVHNLVHNALKFTPPGGRVQVNLDSLPSAQLPASAPAGVRGSEAGVLLSVADTGIGIPAAYLQSIFAGFARVHGPTADVSNQGYGLGLNVVKTLAEAHGGTVWAESEPGNGSTFRVLLPVLSREEHLVRVTAAEIGRVKVAASTLTLVVGRVVPVEAAPVSREEMLTVIEQTVAAVRRTARLQTDRVDILERSQGVVSLLAEIDRDNVPALLRRVRTNLGKQAREQGWMPHVRLVWGMANYPRDGHTAADLVGAALRAAKGSEAVVTDLGRA